LIRCRTLKLRDGPPIIAKVRVALEAIESVTLCPNQQQELLCQLQGEHISESVECWVEAWFSAYVTGTLWLAEIPLRWLALPTFTLSVLNVLKTVPYGHTVTYKELAIMAGNQHAYRAVGSACRRNPFPLLIPCHRVIASKGLGGFSCGLQVKKSLLAHEQKVIMERVKSEKRDGWGERFRFRESEGFGCS